MSKWNKEKFSVYNSEEKTVLGLVKELGEQTNFNTETLEEKTDLTGNHLGSWQGLSRPTLSDEGMRATVELIVDSGEINVKTFGAKGDGKTDDTDNIQRALNVAIEKGKVLYFPNGTYLINRTFKPSTNKLVAVKGESHLGVIFDRFGDSVFDFVFNFEDCNKIYAENLCSPYASFNYINRDVYWQGDKAWVLAHRNKDVYVKNLIYTGTEGHQSYYENIMSPAPKNYDRFADGNYAKYPLEITNCGGYNAININNFSVNEDGSIGFPQDNSAIGIVDRTTNSTGVLFIDMIGDRSFERYVNRNAEGLSSEIRPLTVWEINSLGHLAIGCSTDVNDPVAKGWGTIKMRDKSPKIEMFDINNNNEKYTIAQIGTEFSIKCRDGGFIMDVASGHPVYAGFRWGGINGGLKINQDQSNPVESALVFDNGTHTPSLGLDTEGNLRFGTTPYKMMKECNRVQLVHGAESYYRPQLTNHWQDIGYQFFDTTLNKPIWWNGTKWVDCNGATV